MLLVRNTLFLTLALMPTACGPSPEARLKQIHLAATKGDIETVGRMLDQEPKLLTMVNDQREKVTLLHLAAYSAHDALIELLLERGADPNLKDARNQTPLFGAASSGNPRSIQVLVASGARVDARNAGGDTPLHRAVVERRLDNARVLLDSRADVNAVNGSGMTPLHVALDTADEHVVRLLLERGADVNKPMFGGKTPLQLAASRDDLVKMLLERGAKH